MITSTLKNVDLLYKSWIQSTFEILQRKSKMKENTHLKVESKKGLKWIEIGKWNIYLNHTFQIAEAISSHNHTVWSRNHSSMCHSYHNCSQFHSFQYSTISQFILEEEEKDEYSIQNDIGMFYAHQLKTRDAWENNDENSTNVYHFSRLNYFFYQQLVLLFTLIFPLYNFMTNSLQM